MMKLREIQLRFYSIVLRCVLLYLTDQLLINTGTKLTYQLKALRGEVVDLALNIKDLNRME